MGSLADVRRRGYCDRRLPGAGAIQSMATGLTHGVRHGYWSILGLEVGLMLQLALVAIGLGAVVANSILAFNLIK